ncbi:MAG: hypothetical protein E7G34_24235 [Klebsiella pneumoniae]|nr:hypothetical protein [Klebsiella pneumoniae]
MNRSFLTLTPVILTVLPCLISAAHAEPAVHPAAVKSFDVGGVKTGMSVEQARAAMAKNFSVSADNITATKSGTGHVAYTVTGSEQVLYLVYENQGTRMQVSFEPRIPFDRSNPMAAALITYEIPWTKDNETAMKDAALTKYGTVSAAGMYPLWCEKPLPGTGMGCAPDSARLEVAGTKITLTDPAWQAARISYMNHQNATRPQF